MANDVQRALRGAFPGPQIEPDATLRAWLAQLGVYGVRYGAMGVQTVAPAPGGYTPSLDFSDARNSMYLGGITWL